MFPLGKFFDWKVAKMCLASGRLGDILKPLFRMMHLIIPEWEPVLRKWVATQEAERKSQKHDTIEGRII